MTNVFNGETAGSDLSDGTSNIFINSIKINSVTSTELPLKVDANKEVYSTTLNISDTSGLQAALDSTISNPFVGTLQATDFKSDNIPSYDTTVQALVLSNATKVSKTDTSDQSIVSNLTLTDNTKKITANLETATITLDGTFLRIKDSVGNIIFSLANFPSCSIDADTSINGELLVYHPTDSIVSIKANTKFYNFKVNNAGVFVFDSFPSGILMTHDETSDDIEFYKTVKTTKTTGSFTDDAEFIPKVYVCLLYTSPSPRDS